jgi:hypothetical protein
MDAARGAGATTGGENGGVLCTTVGDDRRISSMSKTDAQVARARSLAKGAQASALRVPSASVSAAASAVVVMRRGTRPRAARRRVAASSASAATHAAPKVVLAYGATPKMVRKQKSAQLACAFADG